MKLKKPKFWDLKTPNFFAYLLFPLTILLRINNLFLKILPKKKFTEIKSICVGNIYLGGTGKTPTTIKLYQLLKEMNLKVITAKKFYSDQYDEQTLLKSKTEFITLKNREKIIQKVINKNYDLIIFDDGLQDIQVDYDLKFVCFDVSNWVGNGFLLPAGPLREKTDNLKNYDAVFLKSNVYNEDIKKIISKVRNISSEIKIFTSKVEIRNIERFSKNKNYLIYSGIGNPKSFRNLIEINKLKIIDEFIFPDHYNYNIEDFNRLIDIAKKKDAKIITTEKDFFKIPDNFKKDIEPVEIEVNIKEESELIDFLRSKIYEKN